MRITTMAVASALAAATVVGGPAVAHAADPDAGTGTGAGAATVSGTPTTTARTAASAAAAGWREGPYSDPEIAAAAAQLTIGIGRATAYYLVQVWDTVRQTTNWWIHYT
ncbi:hypothetical protein ACPCSC_28795 [Streptomyces lavendulocolor]|uniref:hypothetical protein n=1 Tax=Streptomyces lavendulocolor TaxID=67316 RepID=UPI003C2F750E